MWNNNLFVHRLDEIEKRVLLKQLLDDLLSTVDEQLADRYSKQLLLVVVYAPVASGGVCIGLPCCALCILFFTGCM